MTGLQESHFQSALNEHIQKVLLGFSHPKIRGGEAVGLTMWYHDLSNKVTVSAFCLFSAILPTVQVNITHLAVHSQAHTSLLPLCIQGSVI